MEQKGKSKGILENGIDLEQVLNTNKHEKKKVARRRWAILAKALKSPTGSEPSSPTDEYSVRRISSFMLLTTQELQQVSLNTSSPVPLASINKRTWYKYSMTTNNVEYYVNIGHRNRTFSAEDLMGFNNTGNICIWPSEETLTYYVGSNLDLFKEKSVLELGGGMSCLAGFICAKYSLARCVQLTDGNKISVENVQASYYCNTFPCNVVCSVLKWESFHSSDTFDVILCADCLFFDDARNDLVKAIWRLLNDDGVALVMAPKRGKTLDTFIIQSEQQGFACEKILNYNDTVWTKHLALLENADYDENIHYPILIKLTKK